MLQGRGCDHAIGNAKRTFVYTAVIQDRKILMITETDFPAG